MKLISDYCFAVIAILCCTILFSGCACHNPDYLALAHSEFDSKNYNRGIDLVNKAIETDPDSAEAFNLRGMLVRRYVRDAERAIKDFTKAIELKPDFAVAYNNRCLAYNMLRDWKRMAEDADSAVKINPTYSTAIINRAIANQEIGKQAEAMADYDLVLKINSEDKDALDAYFHKAELNYRNRKYSEALMDLNSCYSLMKKIWPDYPHLADINRFRGFIYMHQGNFKLAEAEYKSYIKTAEKPSLYYILLLFVSEAKSGVIDNELLDKHFKNADTKKWPYPIYQMLTDKIDYEKCLKLTQTEKPEITKGNLCEAYFYIGERYLANGNEKEGIAYLKKCIKTDVKNFMEYMIAEKELERLKKQN